MNPTTIEWVLNPDGSQGYTSNPFTGCLGPNNNGIRCPYCYAWKESLGRCRHADLRAFPIPGLGHNDDPFYPRFHPERLDQIRHRPKPAGIFLCNRSDFAAPYWPLEWQAQLWDMIAACPQHRFYLLTHQPHQLSLWSPYPANCFVGATATDAGQAFDAWDGMADVTAKIRFLSLEPLLGPIPIDLLFEYDWLILGACTGTKYELLELCQRWNIDRLVNTEDLALVPYGKKWTLQPKSKWVLEIVDAADKAGIPVFQKDNLKPLLGDILRQELPNEKS